MKTLDSLELSRPVKEAIAVLFLSAVTSVLAGLFLGRYSELLLLIPGLIILLPGSIGMRGSIFASLGSRLSSALHLGLIEKFDPKDPIIIKNTYGSLSLSLILSTVLGIFAFFFSNAIGIQSISISSFITISVLAGVISGIVLLFLTYLISFKSYKHNWDPDNVTAPLISTLGDFFTIPALLLSAVLVIQIEPFVNIIVSVILVLIVIDIFIMVTKKPEYRLIVYQSVPILVATALISTLSGLIIESNIDKLLYFPSMLVLLPAFTGQCGNISNILASKLSTGIHIGTVSKSFEITPGIKREFFDSYKLALVIFPFIAILTFVFSYLVGISVINIFLLIFISLFSGLIVITLLLFISFYFAIIAFRHDIDPDNILIPISSTIADIVGVIVLIAVLFAVGIV